MVTVVVADDEASIRQLLRTTLLGDGRSVVEAVDGDAALAAIRRHAPAVAILDVMMPGLSGLEVCRRVRADSSLVGTRVIISSANAIEAEALEAGADAFLSKPFLPSRMWGGSGCPGGAVGGRSGARTLGAGRFDRRPLDPPTPATLGVRRHRGL